MKKINILLLSCLPFLSFAQTGNGQIDNEQIDIVKDYQPVLLKSDKI